MKSSRFVDLLEAKAPISELKEAFLELSDQEKAEVFSTADAEHSLDGLISSLPLELIYQISVATGDLQLLIEALVERLPFEVKTLLYNVTTNEFKLDEIKSAQTADPSLLFAYKHNKIMLVPDHDDSGVKTGLKLHKELDQKFLLSLIYQFMGDKECPAIATRFGSSAYAVEYRCRPDFASSEEFFAKLEHMSKISGEVPGAQVISLGLVAMALCASLNACGQPPSAVNGAIQAAVTAENFSAIDAVMSDLKVNCSAAYDSASGLFFIQVSSTGTYSPYMSQISSLRFSSLASADSFRLLFLQRVNIRLTTLSTQVLPEQFSAKASAVISDESNYAVTTNYR
jgi:hypothetical protein